MSEQTYINVYKDSNDNEVWLGDEYDAEKPKSSSRFFHKAYELKANGNLIEYVPPAKNYALITSGGTRYFEGQQGQNTRFKFDNGPTSGTYYEVLDNGDLRKINETERLKLYGNRNPFAAAIAKEIKYTASLPTW